MNDLTRNHTTITGDFIEIINEYKRTRQMFTRYNERHLQHYDHHDYWPSQRPMKELTTKYKIWIWSPHVNRKENYHTQNTLERK